MGGQNQSALSGVARTANSRWYCYMIVMEGRNERGERAREGAPSPGVVQAVGSGVRPVGIGAKRTVIGGAGVEHASCGTWRGTWHLGASGGARRGGANKLFVYSTLTRGGEPVAVHQMIDRKKPVMTLWRLNSACTML